MLRRASRSAFIRIETKLQMYSRMWHQLIIFDKQLSCLCVLPWVQLQSKNYSWDYKMGSKQLGARFSDSGFRARWNSFTVGFHLVENQSQELQTIKTWVLTLLHRKVVKKKVQSQIQSTSSYYLSAFCISSPLHFFPFSQENRLTIKILLSPFDKWESWDPKMFPIIIFIVLPLPSSSSEETCLSLLS